ncbi:MAG: hypothetical protein JRH01_19165 [Deltaproteobacteria bacterium]|nr:hypothetical protein [Deltaproteobacteria bacterium]
MKIPRGAQTLAALVLLALPGSAEPFRVGVGDRIEIHRAGRAISVRDEARRHGLATDYLEIWLPRGWEDSWLDPEALRSLTRTGTTPVIAHWFFGDEISQERVEGERAEWHRSLARLARRIAIDAPVIVLLEPEFNNAPPEGETAITDWAGFSDEVREAIRILRHFAPKVQVGLCAGDFSPTRDLEKAVSGVAGELDFLAFQEMRASTRHDKDALNLGEAALSYARYLRQAFAKPVFLGYVAVASYGDWQLAQRDALRSLVRERRALEKAGVFGLVYFQLRDDPEHTGWFGPAERSFGVLNAKGEPKPALEPLRALGERLHAPSGSHRSDPRPR